MNLYFSDIFGSLQQVLHILVQYSAAVRATGRDVRFLSIRIFFCVLVRGSMRRWWTPVRVSFHVFA